MVLLFIAFFLLCFYGFGSFSFRAAAAAAAASAATRSRRGQPWPRPPQGRRTAVLCPDSLTESFRLDR